ncbi:MULTISPECIES: hypothetical protein [Acidithiobacillus]|uniref:Lipoprotein n=2 Tax=Acidithiobacillus TaxID=119977 RepID=A0A179BB77_ACIFR|nr:MULTISPECIES: hypothetical protein [Acidithiobacillus]MEB8486762.1 hypothetical protein [Acidithiobacillus ferriphilus]MEB8488645.1 hypothetical protein [Acidithiobacillus ferriphilus]MEB8493276.1 hypothetical protein [Acidithiobacillus ferriphilus]MEB8513689.1 hypothetical protein [Acidithiobacillus ferriphilus]MEB8522702.1 hypothetical protein [Acidithiobacillus ferriphilus]
MKTSSILKASAIAVTVAALAGCAGPGLTISGFGTNAGSTPGTTAQQVHTGIVVKTFPAKVASSGDFASLTGEKTAGTDIIVKLVGGPLLSIPVVGQSTVSAGETVAVIGEGGHYTVEPMGYMPTSNAAASTSEAPNIAQVHGNVTLTTASPWSRNRARQQAGN